MTSNIGRIELSSSKKMRQIIDMTTKTEEQGSNQKPIPKKRFEYASNKFSGPIDQQLFVRKSDSKTPSENDQIHFHEAQSSDRKGFSTNESGAELAEKLQAVNFSMSKRRKSQGIDKS
jgi:hypothetical protein